MEIRNITDKGKKLCDFVTEKTMQGELSNNDLVQLIEVAGAFLNLKTISDYAKENNKKVTPASAFYLTLLATPTY